MIITRRQIVEGELIPKGYGIAYRNLNLDTIVCYPFPYNIIVGFVRKIYLKIRWYKISEPKIDEIRARYYIQGYNYAMDKNREIMMKYRTKISELEATLHHLLRMGNGEKN